MDIALLSGLTAFAFVSSVTPGPNNLMLMASGANFGFRRSIAHMLGIGIGFTVMIALVGLGLIGIFDRFPASRTVLSLLSLAYVAWLAWKIAGAGAPGRQARPDAASAAHVSPGAPSDAPPDAPQEDGPARPMTFLQAAAFQWVNPKAWAMALTAITAYAPDRSVMAILLVAAIFGLINLPSVSVWTLLGRQIRHLLGTPARLRAFNWTMALLLIASMIPVLEF